MTRLFARDIRDLAARDGPPARDPERVATALMAMLTGWFDTVGSSAEVARDEAILAHESVDLIVKGRAAW